MYIDEEITNLRKYKGKYLYCKKTYNKDFLKGKRYKFIDVWNMRGSIIILVQSIVMIKGIDNIIFKNHFDLKTKEDKIGELLNVI